MLEVMLNIRIYIIGIQCRVSHVENQRDVLEHRHTV